MAEVKYLNARTFRNDGYLQEANRGFFHPLGLALELNMANGTLRVWDCRDDPSGVIFDERDDLRPTAECFAAIREARRSARVKALGYWQQPAGLVTTADAGSRSAERGCEDCHRKLDLILYAVQSMLEKEKKVMKEMDDLVAQVKANEDAEDSGRLLVLGIAARIEAAVAAAQGLTPADKASLVQLTADLKSHADPLAAAVLANTDAAPAAGA
jgi:hypothetical protein